jgi:transcriptional regulator GlxA family with amidase domain
MKTIAIIAFDNFTDVDVFLPWDLFNRIRLREKDCEVKILGTQPTHRSVAGLSVATHGLVEESRLADIVFFASGPGTRILVQDPAYLRRLQLDPERQVIGSMCSGALLLAALGLLNGLSATTYPTAVPALRAYGVEVLEDRHLVTHGNIGTAAGCLAAVDLVAWSLTKVFGEASSQAVVASVQPVGQGQVCIY